MGLVISKEINLFLTGPETGKSEVKVPAGLVSAESLFDHFQYALNMGCLPSPREEEFCSSHSRVSQERVASACRPFCSGIHGSRVLRALRTKV